MLNDEMAQLRAAREKKLKDAYFETDRSWNGNSETFSLRQLSLLKQMAEKDVIPDGDFSDAECCVWEMFRSAYTNY